MGIKEYKKHYKVNNRDSILSYLSLMLSTAYANCKPSYPYSLIKHWLHVCSVSGIVLG